MADHRRILRHSAAVAIVVAAVLCVLAANAGAAPLVLASNAESNSVSVIDAATDLPVGKPIPTGGEPGAIAIVPGGDAYVAETSTGSVGVIDPKTSKRVGRPIAVGGEPEYLALSPDGSTAYVADTAGTELSVIDTAADKVVGTVALGGAPYAIAASPTGKFAYASVGDTLERIDTATREVVGKPIAVGKGPRTIAFTPDGTKAFVSDFDGEAVSIVDTALNQEVGQIPLPGGSPWGLAVSPDGSRLYVANVDGESSIGVYATATGLPVADPIQAGAIPDEVALTPNGRTLYVAAYGSSEVTPIDTTRWTALKPIEFPLAGTWQVAVTPDLTPTAAFTAPTATATFTTIFSGAASTDPDGSVVAWNWTFGDGGTATGVGPSHTYGAAGTYEAKLSVVDNEGCGEAVVFTGRTALCSGGAASLTHPVTAAPVPKAPPSNKFSFGRLVHNRGNGTARLQVKLPAAGSIVLAGPKVHMVRKKIGAAGSLWLTIHARVELNRKLKKTLRAKVRFRVTFSPTGGTARTRARSLTLRRAPHKKNR